MPGQAALSSAPSPGGVAPGWCAKLPGAADFVVGGRPSAFLDALRDWAAEGVAGLWPDVRRDAFLVAPLTRFAATPGVFGASGGVGLVGPGADRLGRPFPVLVAVPLPVADPAGALAASAPWAAGVAGAVRAALAPEAPPERLGAGIAAAPALEPPASGEGARATALFARDGAPVPFAWSGPADARLFDRLFAPPIPAPALRRRAPPPGGRAP